MAREAFEQESGSRGVRTGVAVEAFLQGVQDGGSGSPHRRKGALFHGATGQKIRLLPSSSVKESVQGVRRLFQYAKRERESSFSTLEENALRYNTTYCE